MDIFAAAIAEAASGPKTRGNPLGDGRDRCTWGEVPALLDTLDAAFDAAGLPPGGCPVVVADNTLAGALLILAALRRGGGLVLLPPEAPSADGEALRPPPRFASWRLATTPVEAGDAPFAERLAAAVVAEPLSGPRTPPEVPTAGRLFIRTSGSMGAAKLVVHRFDALAGSGRGCIERYGLSPADRMTLPVPVSHFFGFGAGLIPALLAGCALDLHPRANLLTWLDHERAFDPTVALVTPLLCAMVARSRKKARPYRVVITSTQRIEEDLFRAFDATCAGALLNQYGSTELGPIAACAPGAPLDMRATALGEPFPGVELRLDHEAVGLAPGVGALVVQHAHASDGYVDDDGRWLDRWTGAWRFYGDLARPRPEGGLVLAGRVDNAVKRSGHLVMLGEVEGALSRLPGVEQAQVVAGRAEGPQGPLLAAFCVADPGAALTEEGVLAAARRALPRFAVPDACVLLSRLPTLPSGKADRQALVAQAEARWAMDGARRGGGDERPR